MVAGLLDGLVFFLVVYAGPVTTGHRFGAHGSIYWLTDRIAVEIAQFGVRQFDPAITPWCDPCKGSTMRRGGRQRFVLLEWSHLHFPRCIA